MTAAKPGTLANVPWDLPENLWVDWEWGESVVVLNAGRGAEQGRPLDLRSGSTKGCRPYHLRCRIDPSGRGARADATAKAEGASEVPMGLA